MSLRTTKSYVTVFVISHDISLYPATNPHKGLTILLV